MNTSLPSDECERFSSHAADALSGDYQGHISAAEAQKKKQTHARAGAALAQERNGSHLFKLKVTKRL